MTDPKKLAEEYAKQNEPSQRFITLEEMFLAGYQSRNTEIAELKARLDAALRVIMDVGILGFPLRKELALELIEEEMKK